MKLRSSFANQRVLNRGKHAVDKLGGDAGNGGGNVSGSRCIRDSAMPRIGDSRDRHCA